MLVPLPALNQKVPGTDYSGEFPERKTETKYLMKLEIRQKPADGRQSNHPGDAHQRQQDEHVTH